MPIDSYTDLSPATVPSEEVSTAEQAFYSFVRLAKNKYAPTEIGDSLSLQAILLGILQETNRLAAGLFELAAECAIDILEKQQDNISLQSNKNLLPDELQTAEELLEKIGCAIESTAIPQFLSSLYEHRGDIYFFLEKFEEAKKAFEEAIKTYPYNFQAAFKLHFCSITLKLREATLDFLSSAIDPKVQEAN